jgi:hypothetical protein
MTYSVKGNFSYQVFALQKEGDPIKQKPLQREFEMLADESAWRIRIVLVGNTDFDSFIYSYDRTNSIHYSIPAAGSAAAGSLQTVTVEASPVPATITSAGGEYVWLAFASGCYLKDRTNNRALSFERLNSRTSGAKRYDVSCRFELSSLPPYLPTVFESRATNQAVFFQEDDSLGVVPLPTAFGDTGYTSASFKCGGFTNVQGFRFPTSFEYRKYRPKPGAKTTNDLVCIMIVRGNVTGIATSQQGVDCALPNRRAMIYDLRVPEPNVQYRIEDGAIPLTDSPIVETARDRAMKRFGRNEK